MIIRISCKVDMFLTSILRYIQKPAKWCPVCGLWLGMVWWFFSDDFYSVSLQGAIDLTLPVLPYIFLVFMAVSYECFYDMKRYKIEEIISIGKGNRLSTQKYDFVLLLLLNLMTCGIVYAYHSWFYVQHGIINAALQIYTLRIVVIYVLLVAVLAIVFGWAISFLSNPLYGLSGILLIFYLFDSSFLGFVISLSKSDYSLWRFWTLFCLFFQSGCGIVRDCNYLLSAENIHIFRELFFLFFALAFIIHFGTKKRIMALCSLMISLILLILFFMPSGAVYSFPYMANSFDSVRCDQSYYGEEKQIQVDEQRVKENEGDFQVKQYDVAMRVTDVLHASVTVIPDQCSLPEYQFTLYRLYQVICVNDEKGNELSFQQDGDYLLIKNTKRSLRSMTITYSGASQYFYTTSQAMMLPANFEYIPVAGWHKVFLMEDDGVSGQIFSRELLPEETKFTVNLQVRADYPVYSNLSTTLKGKRKGYCQWEIEGRSDGLTLIGNPYLRQRTIQGVRVVYSLLDQDRGPIQENVSVYEEFFEQLDREGYPMRGKTFIVAPEDNNNNWCIGQDQIVFIPLGLQEILSYYQYDTLYSDVLVTEIPLEE